ncbi:zinc-dependent alcohol dehydrogenase [Alicyclobacillus acidocaldarius]|uniref:Alcohol dehydrogenase GroES domain protein n=1 Tax=Alicyclobacillus acidocaldarius (strain Tc-4-1) TaxID=1048834 RepID=F8IJJ4_ALIAT|nr:alcohol dehydrogenase catalytic domain-containing protein [Alicyclobacillus acidocaldarius]AEJ44707.1 Alcohol dehydrogenase GroES domain protein [Alicyclobacillus acidocaldarius subsp. acidocaldarius Tc-4-1]
MRQLVMEAPSRLHLCEAEAAGSPGTGQVRLHTIMGGICGSDTKVYHGHLRHANYPVRPGHELVARVVEVGEGVDLAPGDRVVIIPNTYCGECAPCRRGQTNVCVHKASIGINAPGGFAEDWLMEAKYAVPVPDEVSDVEAAMVEPFAVAWHAVHRARINVGDEVLVLGSGTEGALCAMLAQSLGARVTAADVREDRLAFVRGIVPGVRTALASELALDSYAVVIEAAGAPDAIATAVACVQPGGCIVALGLAEEARLPMQVFVRKEASLLGSIIYVRQDFEDALARLKGDPDLRHAFDNLCAGIWPLEAYAEAYRHALSGKPGKALIAFEGGASR